MLVVQTGRTAVHEGAKHGQLDVVQDFLGRIPASGSFVTEVRHAKKIRSHTMIDRQTVTMRPHTFTLLSRITHLVNSLIHSLSLTHTLTHSLTHTYTYNNHYHSFVYKTQMNTC